jgi:hypothetical protein
LTNLNHLIPWDINPHNNQTSTTNAAAAGAAQYHQQRTTAVRSYKNNRRGFYYSISFVKISFFFNKFLANASSSIWDVTVRVYIGCEYECPRGHRFMCSSPNHVIRVGPNGVVKVC